MSNNSDIEHVENTRVSTSIIEHRSSTILESTGNVTKDEIEEILAPLKGLMKDSSSDNNDEINSHNKDGIKDVHNMYGEFS